MKVVQEEGKVLSNLEVAASIFLLDLRLPQAAKIAQPGQFLHLRISPLCDPLLRRPFSIHRTKPEKAEVSILYQVVGRGTELLSQKRPEESLDCLGPLGRGFTIPKGAGQFILVAGGIGIAPLIFLAESLLQKKGKGVVFLIGATSENYVLYKKELRCWGATVEVATDDGSEGHRGPVTDLLMQRLDRFAGNPQIFACGPEGMLQKVTQIALQRGIPCQLSLEQRMACGLGACLGCVVNTRSGYRRVCVDGPVFPASEVIFE
ncbi:MAG: dihydroorotate dehydrogenase electron transfer subunit [Candidatus Latescibacterota bacterium]|nr:MAG: dihydroorotate dehydrogenase electron transfer subunit [Candidatus Latescibacterota bacterium]